MDAPSERDLPRAGAYDRGAMKTSDKFVIVSLLAAVVALIALAASAEAATLTLKCSGKGPQSKAQEFSTAFIEAVGDPDSELSAVAQEVNIQRYVTATAKKIGGGR